MNLTNSIDINADLGEFKNEIEFKNELNILKYISSCSVACGGHTGDEKSIKQIIEVCKENSIAIGPHPSYPDEAGFGRRAIKISLTDLQKSIIEQIQRFLTVAESLSMPVRHVKLHGSLYNEVSREERLASFFLNIVDTFEEDLAVIGPSNSVLETMTKQAGINFISEAFIDRRYRENYNLVNRNQDGALLNTIEDQVEQARNILIENKVITDNEKTINLKVETICIHGDSPNAVPVLKAICKMLKEESFDIRPHLR